MDSGWTSAFYVHSICNGETREVDLVHNKIGTTLLRNVEKNYVNKNASHFFPMSLNANEWTVLHNTFLGKRRSASLAIDLLKATYRKRRSGRCSANRSNVLVFPVPAKQQKEKDCFWLVFFIR